MIIKNLTYSELLGSYLVNDESDSCVLCGEWVLRSLHVEEFPPSIDLVISENDDGGEAVQIERVGDICWVDKKGFPRYIYRWLRRKLESYLIEKESAVIYVSVLPH